MYAQMGYWGEYSGHSGLLAGIGIREAFVAPAADPKALVPLLGVALPRATSWLFAVPYVLLALALPVLPRLVRSQGKVLALCGLWFAAYVPFFLWWEPGKGQFWITSLPPALTIAALAVQRWLPRAEASVPAQLSSALSSQYAAAHGFIRRGIANGAALTFAILVLAPALLLGFVNYAGRAEIESDTTRDPVAREADAIERLTNREDLLLLPGDTTLTRRLWYFGRKQPRVQLARLAAKAKGESAFRDALTVRVLHNLRVGADVYATREIARANPGEHVRGAWDADLAAARAVLEAIGELQRVEESPVVLYRLGRESLARPLVPLASVDPGGHRLEWKPPLGDSDTASSAAWRYHIWRADSAGGAYRRISKSPLKSRWVRLTGAKPGKKYFVAVTSVLADGSDSVRSTPVLVQAGPI